MDKMFFFFLALVVLFVYVVTDITSQAQSKSNNSIYIVDNSVDVSEYIGYDNLGQEILLLEGIDYMKQLQVWGNSSLKFEFLEEFPKFLIMADFIDERIKGEPIKSRLKEKLKSVKKDFLSGKISADQAKLELEKFGE